MNLAAPGVFCFLDSLAGSALGPFARKVERLGYSVLWYTEGFGRESLSLGTYLLSQTERLIIASGIAVAFCREPIAASNAARALSELFPGRFILGLGVSNAAGNQRRGVRYESPVAFMRGYLGGMKTAPYGAPPPPTDAPVVLGSLHPRMIALAAAETAGVLTYFTPPEKTAQIRAALGLEKWLCAEQAVLLEQDATRARAAARAYMYRICASRTTPPCWGRSGLSPQISWTAVVTSLWTRSWPGAPKTRCAAGSRRTGPPGRITSAFFHSGRMGL